MFLYASHRSMAQFRARVAPVVLCLPAVLVAACSQEDTPEPPPLNQAPTMAALPAFAATALEPFTYSVTASDPDGDPLTFSLTRAPAGMSIDARSGAIGWTPRLDQWGEHLVRVSVTDSHGSVFSQLANATVTMPAGFPPVIALKSNAPGYALGRPVHVDWALAGEMPAGAAVQLWVRAPVIVPNADGSPAEIEWTLSDTDQWSVEPSNARTPAAAGAMDLTLPSTAAGPWQIEARLVDAESNVLARSGRTILVSDVPALHLTLNRPIANSLDYVRASLIESAGATPAEVRLVAWLVKPDGAIVGLPGLGRSLEIRHGDGTNAEHALLDRPFVAAEAGDYRIHARLYDETTRQLLQDASAKFSVCDGAAAIEGTVSTADAAPLDGRRSATASVQALDVDDAAVISSAAIGSDGRYELSVPPGRYLVSAVFIDENGNRYQAGSGLTDVGCASAPLTVNLALGTSP